MLCLYIHCWMSCFLPNCLWLTMPGRHVQHRPPPAVPVLGRPHHVHQVHHGQGTRQPIARHLSSLRQSVSWSSYHVSYIHFLFIPCKQLSPATHTCQHFRHNHGTPVFQNSAVLRLTLHTQYKTSTYRWSLTPTTLPWPGLQSYLLSLTVLQTK